MGVTFVLGRAGSGKTHFCTRAVLAELERPEESRLLLLVPEQASFQMERALALASTRHGFWRAEVLSFSRLARRLFDEVGGGRGVLSDGARRLALRAVGERLPGELRAFGGAASSPGFFVQLDRLIEELLRENVAPEALAATAGALSDAAARGRVAAIARLYRAYLDWLGPARVDPAQRLAELRSRLDRLGWLDGAKLWVDGFAGFMESEIGILIELARRARRTCVTLLLDPERAATDEPPRDSPRLFARTERTYLRLRRRLEQAGVPIEPPVLLSAGPPPRFAAAPRLAQLEARLATARTGDGALPRFAPVERLDASPPPSARGIVRVVECLTHREEIEAAARDIRARLADAGGALRFRDFALIARDLEPLADLAADVLEDYEIPYFVDRRRPLRAHALTRFVGALLDAAQRDLPVDAMSRLLQSGLLPARRAEAERIEYLIVRHEVSGQRTWAEEAWSFAREGGAAGARREIGAAFEPLTRAAGADEPPTGGEWARLLYEALRRLRVDRRMAAWVARARAAGRWEAAETHRLAWERIVDVLEDFDGALGQTALSIGEFAGLVRAALTDASLALAPPTLDQVLVGAIERSRHPEIKYAWVFAFNDGVFPRPPPPETLLSLDERVDLRRAGLDGLGLRREDVFAEPLLAYIALTRPSLGLTISFAARAADGSPMFPSPLLADVRAALGELPIERDAVPPPPACLSELARGWLESHWERRSGDADVVRRFDRVCEVVRGDADHGQRLDWLLRGAAYRNAPAAVSNFRKPAAGAEPAQVDWDASPSEVDVYLQCPFKHFCRYGLGLRAERGPTPTAQELGGVAHEVLADVLRRAIASGRPAAQIEDAQWLDFLDGALRAVESGRAAEPARRNPRRAFLAEVLADSLRELVLAHADRFRRGRFEPLAAELEFSFVPMTPTPPTGVAGPRVRLHGRIDRVDAARDGGDEHRLVYDYKSTPDAKALRGRYLVGHALQLYGYLLAAEASGGATPAGVLMAPLFAQARVLEKRYAAAADPRTQRMYLFRPRGVIEERAARLLDQRLGTSPSPVAMLRLTSGDRHYANSDATRAADIAARLVQARATILQAASGVASGRIDVSPLLAGGRLPCARCDFEAVCRVEPGPRRRAEDLPKFQPAPRGDPT